jgi:hypothetical protein
LWGVIGVELERAFHKRRYVSEDPLANKRVGGLLAGLER